MKSKFEQLIEYVINDDNQKAKELFHNIVVEKSREIYENLISDEDVEEDVEEDIEEGMEDTSGNASQDLMREVETDETGMNEEDEMDFDDEEDVDNLTHDTEQDHDEFSDDEGSEDLEDRVVDLEDKLDELMAEFEELMSDDNHDDMEGDSEFDMEPEDDAVGGDAYMDDDTSEFEDEPMPMSENVSLEKVAPPKHGDNGHNTKSPTAFNSGVAGMEGKPVRNVASEANPDGTSAYKAPNSYADKGRGDLPGAGKFKNTPAKGGYGSKMEPATKPHLAQAPGVNTKTPFPRG
jgi:hypothetical protein